VTRKQRTATLAWVRKFYSTARDRGDFVELLAGKDDTKYIWIFMFSKVFIELE
jgi:hypothetical protein